MPTAANKCWQFVTRCHSDGTVSYWSHLLKSRRDHVAWVPSRDLEQMPKEDSRRISAHLERNGYGESKNQVARRFRTSAYPIA